MSKKYYVLRNDHQVGSLYVERHSNKIDIVAWVKKDVATRFSYKDALTFKDVLHHDLKLELEEVEQEQKIDTIFGEDEKPKISLDLYIKMQYELLIDIMKSEQQSGRDGSRIKVSMCKELVDKLLKENNVSVEGLR